MKVKGEGKKRKTPDARAREAYPFFTSQCNIFDSGWQVYFKGKEDNLWFWTFLFRCNALFLYLCQNFVVIPLV